MTKLTRQQLREAAQQLAVPVAPIPDLFMASLAQRAELKAQWQRGLIEAALVQYARGQLPKHLRWIVQRPQLVWCWSRLFPDSVPVVLRDWKYPEQWRIISAREARELHELHNYSLEGAVH